MTQSAFKPKNSHLDVIREHNTHKEEDEEEESDGAAGGKDHNEDGGREIAKRVKRGVQNRLAQNARISDSKASNSSNTTMTSSVLHNTGSSIMNNSTSTTAAD